MTSPKGLRSRGKALWAGILDDNPDLDNNQLAMLEEACRQRDRCESLAAAAASGDPGALRHERDSAMAMARLLSALRLPDAKTGKRPMARQLRGVDKPATVVDMRSRVAT